jgi:uncharacterized protein YbjT (DUF2867 family)
MHIFLTGSSGFIGRHLLKAFLSQGHSVTCAVRALPAIQMPNVRYVTADFSRNVNPEDWMPFLDGIDVVVNAVGIIREHDGQRFHVLHTQAPIALFKASMQKKVKLILQLSALGADEKAIAKYHLSKKAADDFLMQANLPAVILQPSLVYGPDGASAALFNTLASMPILFQFGKGQQMIQPVHIDDVVDVAIHFLSHSPSSPQKKALVGPEAMTLTGFLKSLRQLMKLPAPFIIPIPLAVARLGAAVSGNFKHSLLDRETFQMLERGNTADAQGMTALLGRDPRKVSAFLEPAQMATIRRAAILNWSLPVLRLSIAFVWIVTGVISLGIYPVSESYALLAQVGINGWLAPVMLYGAACFDLAIGIALLLIHRKWIWQVQAVLIIFYSVVIAWKLPDFLTHPYGPVLKNLPMLAIIWLMQSLEEK